MVLQYLNAGYVMTVRCHML